jgi:hypothetical protein
MRYPHPDLGADAALVELIVADEPMQPDATADSGWLAGVRRAVHENLPGVKWQSGIREAWAVDLPAADFDRVLRDLAANGCFDAELVSGNGALLAGEIDGANLRKTCGRVDALEVLARRVREQGHLVSVKPRVGMALR